MRSSQQQNHRQATRRRARRNASISVEPLEGRALLSGLHGLSANHAYAALPNSAHVAALSVQHNQHQHPLTNSVVLLARKPSGVVTKRPKFYELYTGPMLKELNATKASVKYSKSRNTFTITGTVQGKITDSQGLYVWGFDRNGNLPAGPFTNRPNVKFDAVVAVSLDSSLTPTAKVIDISTFNITTLPASAVHVKGKTITITVPASLLPSTGLAPSQYRFNFWPDFGSEQSVASFIPESGDAQVGTSK
jgi:hypothetical protein